MQSVVMDYVNVYEQTLADAREQLEVALQTFHVKDYVLGDLRCVNILLDGDKKLKLIDFDWAGPFDMTITDAGLPVELQKKIGKRELTGQLVITCAIR
jgi:serine/threonine protein kinase